jgi:hypothetical protein
MVVCFSGISICALVVRSLLKFYIQENMKLKMGSVNEKERVGYKRDGNKDLLRSIGRDDQRNLSALVQQYGRCLNV